MPKIHDDDKDAYALGLEEIGRRIRAARESAGYQQNEFARAVLARWMWARRVMRSRLPRAAETDELVP